MFTRSGNSHQKPHGIPNASISQVPVTLRGPRPIGWAQHDLVPGTAPQAESHGEDGYDEIMDAMPICSVYGIFYLHLGDLCWANVGKYSIHGAYGVGRIWK